jgi:hypothetical protein
MPNVARPLRGAIKAERREIKAPGDSGIVQEGKKHETRKPPLAIHGFPLIWCSVFDGFLLPVRHSLEEQLQRKLNLPRRVVGIGHNHLTERRTHRASSNLGSGWHLVRCGVVVLVVGNEEARSVGQIKDLGAELQLQSFPYGKVLKHREREITEARAVKSVTASIADGAQKRHFEGIVIEKFGVAWVGQAGIRDLVWTGRPPSDSVEH